MKKIEGTCKGIKQEFDKILSSFKWASTVAGVHFTARGMNSPQSWSSQNRLVGLTWGPRHFPPTTTTDTHTHTHCPRPPLLISQPVLSRGSNSWEWLPCLTEAAILPENLLDSSNWPPPTPLVSSGSSPVRQAFFNTHIQRCVADLAFHSVLLIQILERNLFLFHLEWLAITQTAFWRLMVIGNHMRDCVSLFALASRMLRAKSVY